MSTDGQARDRSEWQKCLNDHREGNFSVAPHMEGIYGYWFKEGLAAERARSKVLVEALEKVLKRRSCSSHTIGNCPSVDEKDFYIPAHEALKQYRGEG